MQKLIYEIEIKAPKSTVWQILIDKEKFKIWSQAFSPNSDYRGEWGEGNEIEFIDAGKGGTVVRIDKFKPNELVSATHIATLTKDFVRETTGEFTGKWIGTQEIYRLKETGDVTTLTIEMQAHKDYASMFEDSWPQALNEIKRLAENL